MNIFRPGNHGFPLFSIALERLLILKVLILLLFPVICEAQSATALERRAEKKAEQQAEKQLEKQLSRKIERQIEKQADRKIARQAEKAANIDKLRGQERAAQVRSEKAKAYGKGGKFGSARAQNKKKFDYHSIVKQDGSYRIRNQWLLMTDEATVADLQDTDLKILKITPLDGIGLVLLELEGPPGALPSVLQKQKSTFRGDFNHLYVQQAKGPKRKPESPSIDYWSPKEALNIDVELASNLTIGLMDSQVNLEHDALKQANIHSRSFIEEGLQAPQDHGTAVASILVGDDDAYSGLLSGAQLYAANVFYETELLGQAASVKSLLLALDWMLQADVEIINMSLAGPPNSILELALQKVDANEVSLVAAAGNFGPGADPAYPAAYENVIAVTAVNKKLHAYYKANRGNYIDIAAPGVNIKHASSKGQYISSTGTSYAAPFISAALAYLKSIYSPQEAKRVLMENAIDLGDKGFDKVYGSGFVQLPSKIANK